MLQALDLMDEILYIIGTILVAFHAVEVVDIVSSLVLVLLHRLHGSEALVAIFERAWYLVGRSSHNFRVTHNSRVTVGPNAVSEDEDARTRGFLSSGNVEG